LAAESGEGFSAAEGRSSFLNDFMRPAAPPPDSDFASLSHRDAGTKNFLSTRARARFTRTLQISKSFLRAFFQKSAFFASPLEVN
jgi:hypothetical protein